MLDDVNCISVTLYLISEVGVGGEGRIMWRLLETFTYLTFTACTCIRFEIEYPVEVSKRKKGKNTEEWKRMDSCKLQGSKGVMNDRGVGEK